MSNLILRKREIRKTLLFCHHLKKTAAESHGMLLEIYADNALSETTCRDWFRRFETVVEYQEHPGQPKMFQDTELQALLDKNDSQTQQELTEQLGVAWSTISDCLKAMEKIHKEGKWVPYELNEKQH